MVGEAAMTRVSGALKQLWQGCQSNFSASAEVTWVKKDDEALRLDPQLAEAYANRALASTYLGEDWGGQ